MPNSLPKLMFHPSDFKTEPLAMSRLLMRKKTDFEFHSWREFHPSAQTYKAFSVRSGGRNGESGKEVKRQQCAKQVAAEPRM